MYNLERFKEAQKIHYTKALEEIRNGRKESHWIWYIFPQLKGLGFSENATYYGISSLDEAKAYMADPELSTRLIEISETLLNLDTSDPVEVLGIVDAKKVRSSMTLFMNASDNPVFRNVLDKYYQGKADETTVALIHR